MTYFFYDLETSGLNARFDRILQFAGQRTDMNLVPIREPVNILIKLTSDILPDPEAILINTITPQMSLKEGVTEVEFLKLFYDEVFEADTIFLGYNSISFDDKFMRFLNYRNFYDAYKWQYANGCSRWDLLDVVRMMRALRPEGLRWPFNSDGSTSNKLQDLTKLNHIDHVNAHNALVDVKATISLAQLIKKMQPKLFDFLLFMRDKKNVTALILSNQPFVYSSSTYPDEFEKTTVVASLGQVPKKQSALVYDLRHDPDEFKKLSVAELLKRWPNWHNKSQQRSLPIKVVQFNQCPAVAPIKVLDTSSQSRLQLEIGLVNQNFEKLQKSKSFVEKIFQVLELNEKKAQIKWTSNDQSVDGQLCNGFFDDHDIKMFPIIRQSSPSELTRFVRDVHDPRLKGLLPLYKARNYPDYLTPNEQLNWQAFCRQRLFSGGEESELSKYMKQLTKLANQYRGSSELKVIKDLRLYGKSLKPAD